jgi:hypothetical protein
MYSYVRILVLQSVMYKNTSHMKQQMNDICVYFPLLSRFR